MWSAQFTCLWISQLTHFNDEFTWNSRCDLAKLWSQSRNFEKDSLQLQDGAEWDVSPRPLKTHIKWNGNFRDIAMIRGKTFKNQTSPSGSRDLVLVCCAGTCLIWVELHSTPAAHCNFLLPWEHPLFSLRSKLDVTKHVKQLNQSQTNSCIAEKSSSLHMPISSKCAASFSWPHTCVLAITFF